MGTTPLHHAAYNNSKGIAEVILKAGIGPDSRNKVDRTPLHVAAQLAHMDIVRLLLAFNANPNAKDMVSPLNVYLLSDIDKFINQSFYFITLVLRFTSNKSCFFFFI